MMRPVLASRQEAVHRAMKMSMLSAVRVQVTLRQQGSSLTLTIREAAPATAKDRSAGRPSVSLRDWQQADRYWRVAQELGKALEALLLTAPPPAPRSLVGVTVCVTPSGDSVADADHQPASIGRKHEGKPCSPPASDDWP